MAKVIEILGDRVSIGMDDGSILEVSASTLSFVPVLGEAVEIYRSDSRVIVAQKDPSPVVTRTAPGIQPQPQVQPQVQPQSDVQLYPQNIVINNQIQNTVPQGQLKNKWVALILCFFFGVFGVHKFYENKIGMGILYLFTMGLFGIGVIVDLIILLFKPTEYIP